MTATVSARTYEILWDTIPPNLYELRQAAKLQVGDQLHFTYNPQDHNVLEVSLAAFLECDTLVPNQEWIGGDTLVTLDTAKTYYFIDGLQGHCYSRQYLVVVAQGHHGKGSNSTPLAAPLVQGRAAPIARASSPSPSPSFNTTAPAPPSSSFTTAPAPPAPPAQAAPSTPFVQINNATIAKAPSPAPRRSDGIRQRDTSQLTWVLIPLVLVLWLNKEDFS
ncbi:unnamed protein product [Calypogeia fissa]